MKRLAAASGTLSKLGFSVRRIVDVDKWGAFAEENYLTGVRLDLSTVAVL
jgi:hypothetical protein